MTEKDEHLVQPKLRSLPKDVQNMNLDLTIDARDFGNYVVPKPGVTLEDWQLKAFYRIKNYDRLRDGTTPVHPDDEEFGTRLLASLLSSQDAYNGFYNTLLSPDDKVLLDVIASDPDLLNYPWETCAHANWEKLGLPSPANKVAVARTTGGYIERWPVHEPVRILIAGVSAFGITTPNFDKEFGAIEGSLLDSGLEKNVRFATYPLRETTIDTLQQDVYEYQPHIVHLVTHGKYGEHYFESSNGDLIEIDSSLLADALDVGRNSLCLFISTACLAMKDNLKDNVWGLGRRLSTVVPVTIGMQLFITEEAALEFTKTFYQALGTPSPIIDAFVRARERIKAIRPGSPEWIAPVLYRGVSKNNLIFSRQNMPVLLKVFIQKLNEKIDGLRLSIYSSILWDEVNEIIYDIDVKLIDAEKSEKIRLNEKQKAFLTEIGRYTKSVRGVYNTTKRFLRLCDNARNDFELAKLELEFNIGTTISDNLEYVVLIRDNLIRMLQFANEARR